MTMGNPLVISLAFVLTVASLVAVNASEWLALGLIILAGIPHGSFDLRVAEARWLPWCRSRLAVLALYVLIGAAMSAVCLTFPGIGIAVFLAISALHFAQGEMPDSSRTSAACFGVAAITCPIAFHPEAAQGYLSFFVPEAAFAQATPAIRALGVVLFAACIVSTALDVHRGRSSQLLQRLVCLCAWLVLPPLSGFAVWFIGRHSRQHLSQCRELFKGARFGLPSDFIVISLLAILLIIPLAARFNLSDIHELFAASIVLIAGLTLPHMIVSHDLRGTLEQMRHRA